jgi:hypothetical protein
VTFTVFLDFPIFRLFAGRKTIPVHSLDFQGFSDFPISGYLPAAKRWCARAAMLRQSREFLMDLYFYYRLQQLQN